MSYMVTVMYYTFLCVFEADWTISPVYFMLYVKQGWAETSLGPWANVVFMAIWALFKFVTIRGSGPLNQWAQRIALMCLG